MPDLADQIRRRNREHRAAGVSHAVPADRAMTDTAQMTAPARPDHEQITRPPGHRNQHRAGGSAHGQGREHQIWRRTAQRVDQRRTQHVRCLLPPQAQQRWTWRTPVGKFTAHRQPRHHRDQLHSPQTGLLDRRMQRRKIAERATDSHHDPANTSRRHRATALDEPTVTHRTLSGTAWQRPQSIRHAGPSATL